MSMDKNSVNITNISCHKLSTCHAQAIDSGKTI